MSWRTALILSAVLNLILLPVLASLSPQSNSESTTPIEIELTETIETLPQQINSYSIPTDRPSPALTQTPTIDNNTLPSISPSDNASVNEMAGLTFSSNSNISTGVNTSLPANTTEESPSSSTSSSAPSAAPQSVILKPRIIEKVRIYPDEARQENLEGIVYLSVEILTNGRAGNIQISTSSGYAVLDNAAIQSVKQWLFEPARDSITGHAVNSTVNFSLRFNFNN